MTHDSQYEFNTVYPLSEVDEEGRDEASCSACPSSTGPWPVAKLSAVRISHRTYRNGAPRRDAAGQWVLYCPEHLERYLNPDAGKKRPVRHQKAAPQEKPAVCPSCFMVLPLATGICDNCD